MVPPNVCWHRQRRQRQVIPCFLLVELSLLLTLLMISIPRFYAINLDIQHHEECIDLRAQCTKLASNGECENNSSWMQSHCPKSCGTCHRLVQQISALKSFNKVKVRKWYSIQDAWGSDLGVPQIISESLLLKRKYEAGDNSTNTVTNIRDEIVELIQKGRDYLHDEVMVDEKYKLVRDKCRNYNESCAEWAIDRWCERDPTYMAKDCGPTCQACEQLHLQVRCPLPHPNDVLNGTLVKNKMLNGLTQSNHFLIIFVCDSRTNLNILSAHFIVLFITSISHGLLKLGIPVI
jgi:ShK domain-like